MSADAPTHVICPAEEDIPGKLPEYLTAGKTYEVATLCAEDVGFDFIGDDGHLNSGLWKECAHLNGADWIPVYADNGLSDEAKDDLRCSGARVPGEHVTTWADVGPGLLEALRECADWMEELRASGDAGFWDWRDDCPYSHARAAIASAEKVESHE